MINLKCFLILLAITSFICCKDDERTIDMSNFTSHDWQLIQMQLKVRNPIATQYNTDSVIFPDNCDTSDYIHFFSDSSFVKYNIEKCDSSEDNTYKGYWSYNKRNHHIIFSDDYGKEEYQLYELVNDKLVLLQEIESVVMYKNKRYSIYTRKLFSYKAKV